MNGYYGFAPYVTVAEKRARAESLLRKLKKKDPSISPIVMKPRAKIAKLFWGISWCRHIETYEDLAYRAERGRSYLRANAVVDLRIRGRNVNALVCGSSLYDVRIKFKKVSNSHWRSLTKKCVGEISTVVDLLAGDFSPKISELVTDPEIGLFPAPHEITFGCNCLDYADMCKHVAAVMYGIGVRFDEDPTLFFGLRGVDPQDLLTKAGDQLSDIQTDDEVSTLETAFGIEIDQGS